MTCMANGIKLTRLPSCRSFIVITLFSFVGSNQCFMGFSKNITWYVTSVCMKIDCMLLIPKPEGDITCAKMEGETSDQTGGLNLGLGYG